MAAVTGASPDVHRVLAREDLLTLAAAADVAVGIVRQREQLARQTEDEQHLFALALAHQLATARRELGWAVRSQAWDHAGVIVAFCELVEIPVECPYTAEQLHDRALRELADHRPAAVAAGLDRDLTLGVFHRYHAARNLRRIGKYADAVRLVMRPETDLYGTGAEPHLAHYLYEVGASYLSQGQAHQLDGTLGEWDGYWRRGRATGYSTRYRFDFIRALARWETGPADHLVIELLDSALNRLRAGSPAGGPASRDAPAGPDSDRGVQELSVTLARAELLAGREPTAQRCAEAVRLGARALVVADRVRARWRVIARSRAPLAVVFRRVYGDIARLAARLPGPDAAELGFRVALSAKQTGFAARIRAGRDLMNPVVTGLIDDIVRIEERPGDAFVGDDHTDRQELSRLRFQLAEAVSPMLADTVLPAPTELDGLIRTIGNRYALDFLELPDTANQLQLFRTLIEPGGAMTFERFEVDPGPRAFFERKRQEGGLAEGLRAAEERDRAGRPAGPEHRDADPAPWPGRPAPDRPDWRALAGAVLPGRLLAELRAGAAATGRPAELLISAHSWLSLLPWAALTLDDRGTRLVERAVLTQCPVLTCLSYPRPPAVTGTALIRLVGKDEQGVLVGRERRAWGWTDGHTGTPLSQCPVPDGAAPVALPGRFDQALAEPGRWQFAHIASHGGGTGLDQRLSIPGEALSAARALGLKWPQSVLMASCHVGQVVNSQEAEPLNFVMALLTGGARCVVAGIDSVDDAGTGLVASQLVRAVRERGGSMDVALREAQLAAIQEGTPETGWALLSAYVQ